MQLPKTEPLVTPLEKLLNLRIEAMSKYALLIKRAEEILLDDLKEIDTTGNFRRIGDSIKLAGTDLHKVLPKDAN